jgi:DegV family protein with EDD domain
VSLPVAVVTDSTSDIDAATGEALGIDVVPLFINFGDERLRDGLEITRSEFYRRLAVQLPTTSQPTSGAFEDVFARHVAAGRAVVCVTISSRLSGTINAATAAAAQFPGAEIRIVESGTVCAGLALQARHAARLAHAGASADAIVLALGDDRTHQFGFAAVPDLSHVVRTGRLSKAQAFIGSLVKLVPVLVLDDGAIREEARVRTFARAKDRVIEATLRSVAALGSARVAVIHANAPPIAAEVAAKVREQGGAAIVELIEMEAGPAIAVHAGPGAVGAFIAPA